MSEPTKDEMRAAIVDACWRSDDGMGGEACVFCGAGFPDYRHRIGCMAVRCGAPVERERLEPPTERHGAIHELLGNVSLPIRMPRITYADVPAKARIVKIVGDFGYRVREKSFPPKGDE